MALSPDNSTLYVGGGFQHVGPQVGAGILVDATTGARLNTSSWPYINGFVNAAVADPNLPGAYYIVGHFNEVGSMYRNGAAHIRPDGSVDGWDPKLNAGAQTVAVGAGKVFLGGSFTKSNGTVHNYVAEVDPVDGTASAWDPNLNNWVDSLAVSGNTLYIGGMFTTVNGTITRHYVAAVDVNTGIATAWNPNLGGLAESVYSIYITGNTAYLGGLFTTVGGLGRNFAAAVDTLSGIPNSWNPSPDGYVMTIVPGNGVLYLGGTFSHVNGSTPRAGAAAVDPTSGIATAWEQQTSAPLGPIVTAHSIAVSGDTVYLGGEFKGINKYGAIAVSATTGIATSWDPKVYGEVLSIIVNGSSIFLGGWFSGLSLADRNGAAAISTATGALEPWNPNPNNMVSAIAVNGGTVYLGGYFTGVGGNVRNHAAAVDAVTGALTSWDPNLNNPVNAMVIGNNAVYLGGTFTTANGTIVRNRAASVDLSNGLLNAWDPNVTGSLPLGVNAMAMLGNTIYLGGQFTQVGGTVRNGVAAVDATSGALTAWDPQLTKTIPGVPIPDIPYVSSIAIAGDTIYLGGSFSAANGNLARNSAVAVDSKVGTATSWNPNVMIVNPSSPTPSLNGNVTAIAVNAGTVYLGGVFNTINGSLSRSGAAAVDAIDGTATAWNPLSSAGHAMWDPGSPYTVNSLLSLGGTVWLGGSFDFPFHYLAPVDATSGALIPSLLMTGP